MEGYTADPTTDLAGCLEEVIAKITNTRISETKLQPPAEIRSDVIVRRDGPYSCPLWTLDSNPEHVWTVGQFARTEILVVGSMSESRLMCASFDTNNDAHTWKVWPQPGQFGGVKDIVCSRDARKILVNSDTGIWLMEPETTAVHYSSQPATLVAVSADGKIVATVTDGKPLQIGWIDTGKRVEWNIGPVTAIALNGLGVIGAALHEDGSVHVAELDLQKQELTGRSAPITVRPSDKTTLYAFARDKLDLVHPVTEVAQWLWLSDAGNCIAVGTQHHLAVFNGRGQSVFINDRAAPVCAAAVKGGFAFMDVAGLAHCYEFGGKRAVVTVEPPANLYPEQSQTPHWYEPPANCICACCDARSKWDTRRGRGVILLTGTELFPLWTADPWGCVQYCAQ